MTDGALRDASVEELFARSGALLDGHFLLKSGRHAGRYLEKFLVLQHPAIGVELCRRFAEVLQPYRPTLVVGPTTGGVLLSFETARQLGGEARAAFAELIGDGGGRALRRGWTVAPGERVAIVDDILTTGASLQETVEAVRAAGVEPAAAAIIVDRSVEPIKIGVPLHALGRIEIPSWEADVCELCRAGVPVHRPGSS